MKKPHITRIFCLHCAAHNSTEMASDKDKRHTRDDDGFLRATQRARTPIRQSKKNGDEKGSKVIRCAAAGYVRVCVCVTKGLLG